jgi:hypothetical protein
MLKKMPDIMHELAAAIYDSAIIKEGVIKMLSIRIHPL